MQLFPHFGELLLHMLLSERLNVSCLFIIVDFLQKLDLLIEDFFFFVQLFYFYCQIIVLFL